MKSWIVRMQFDVLDKDAPDDAGDEFALNKINALLGQLQVANVQIAVWDNKVEESVK